MIISVKTDEHGYDVVIENGSLNRAEEYFDLNRKVLIVSDSGVPSKYYDIIASKCLNPIKKIIPQGEKSKSLETFEELLETMLQEEFCRNDCVVAVGGGVVGDLSGFVASCYMRGIDFYNVPTTLLSQVDSSVGGKTAVNFCGIKNSVGSFYQPKAVIIDPDVLETLDPRQFSSGLVEAIKMAATSDKKLFDLIYKSENIKDDLTEIIFRSVDIKKCIVEEDPTESGVRRVLNYGHTIGHAIEASCKGKILHGEAVAIGMFSMCSDEVKDQLCGVFNKYGIPTNAEFCAKTLLDLILHDKKNNGERIKDIFVDKIGSYRFEELTASEIIGKLEKIL